MRLKLAPHMLPGGETDTHDWLQLNPTVAKFVYNFDVAASAPPTVLCVGKPDEAFLVHHVVLSGDPVALAAQYTAEIFAPLVKQYPRIDVWEGPNEIAFAPDALDRFNWYAAFLAEFGRQMALLGKRAGLGGWAVGNPEFNLWAYYGPVLQACRDHKAILTRHAYGPLDQWYSFRHRNDEAAFQKLGFSNTPVIISECGADKLGNFPGKWRDLWGADHVATYWNEYLLPFTQEIEKDPYVLGATVFTVGNGFSGVWNAFDVSGTGLIPHLAAYVQSLPPDPPAQPVDAPGAADVPSFELYRIKAQQLKARLHPWTGETEPPVTAQLTQGQTVKVYGIFKPEGMTYGWGSLSLDSDQWINMLYAERVP
jgi:hypothetical protein